LFSQKVRRAEITDVPTSSSRTTLLRSPDVFLVRGFFSFAKPAMGVGFGRRMFLSLTVSELGRKEHRLRLGRGRQLGNRRMHMKKISVIGATLLGATVLFAAPISLHLSQDKGMSLSVDKAQAYIPAGTPCKEAAKLAFPTDRKTRHAFKRECKQAWKAQNKGA
jgi:hypothetical protein